ncbi:hypothetical protein GP486_004964 [Trichoglossum hirsutum]|uniref:Uncharacterized protein n=1 Tax=Trichoglossum hirsutum TaxID=265104 RepID=A0A9P8RN37_9PEZI|nr:hypothetical protein GP486_004964 [Trichoglossum hirsutum]
MQTSASSHRSPMLEGDRSALSNSARDSFNAGASASSPWLPYERHSRTLFSSPVAPSSPRLGTNSSSRASSSTLMSPTLNYNQSDLSLVSNSRPSLALQIELDRRKEKTQRIITRIEQEEDERVRAYRAEVESDQCRIESEAGPASRRDDDPSEAYDSGSLSPDLEIPSPPSPARSRQSRGSTSTSLTSQSAQTGSGQDDNLLRRRPLQTLPTADIDTPPNPAPREISQRPPERNIEHPDFTRRESKGIYADVDEFISGLGIYGQRKRTRKSLTTTIPLLPLLLNRTRRKTST